MDAELKREVLYDNYTNPKNKEDDISDESYTYENANNASCIDNINLYIKFNGNIIEDIKFNGEACAISTASTSIMIKELIGKTLDEALHFIDNFDNMVHEKEYDASLFSEAIVFDEIYKQQNRITCATLPYIGIKKAIEKQKASL